MVYWVVSRPQTSTLPVCDTRLGPFDSRERAEAALRTLGNNRPRRYAVVCDYG